MALIICPECRKEISNVVKACPHCGYPIVEESNEEIKTIQQVEVSTNKRVDSSGSMNKNNIIALVLFLVIIGIGFGFKTINDNPNRISNNLAIESISKQLKAPSTAKYEMTDIIELGEGEDRSLSFIMIVDAENSYGAKIRKEWLCSTHIKDGEWYLLYANEM